MKKAVVTGANGFIGSALCKALSEHGVEVFAVVRDGHKDISAIKDLQGISIVSCNLSDFRNLAQYIPDRDVDILYHLAWTGSAGPLRADADVQLDNIKYTCDTVRACRDMGCGRFVFAASIMEYEVMAVMDSGRLPDPNTLYSSAKLSADFLARTVAAQCGVDYMRAVVSNVYGPGEASARLVNTSLRKMLAGEHCAFSAGEQIYDFIYISDAAEAFVAIGEKGKQNKAYYIGSLNPRPLKEFLTDMKNQVDPELEIGLGEMPFNGISLTYHEFDIYAVRDDTGFVPSVDFAEGIRRTIEWMGGEG